MKQITVSRGRHKWYFSKDIPKSQAAKALLLQGLSRLHMVLAEFWPACDNDG
jgi:hypothetical protein